MEEKRRFYTEKKKKRYERNDMQMIKKVKEIYDENYSTG